MMISAEALHEREWHRYPALRQALETAEVPAYYTGFTSVSDTVFDNITRLMKHSILIQEYQAKIIEGGCGAPYGCPIFSTSELFAASASVPKSWMLGARLYSWQIERVAAMR